LLVQLDVFTLRLLTLSWLLGSLAVGLSLSLGYAGIFNMSQGTFYGIGAYTAAIIVTRFQLPYELAILGSAVVAGAMGLLLGLTTLRIRGDYWSLVSMAFTVGLVKVLENWKPVTNGKDGYVGIPVLSAFGVTLNNGVRFYYASFVVLIVSFTVVHILTRSFAGRAMLATRYDETAAAMMGISPLYYKLLALAIGSAIAGLAGSCLIAVSGYIHPNDFGLLPSFAVTLFVIVGGSTSLIGAVIAATFLTLVIEEFRILTDFQYLIYGTAILVGIFLRAGVFRSILKAPASKGIQQIVRVPGYRKTV
jgi:branched-chain amino acid transport system permease protein